MTLKDSTQLYKPMLQPDSAGVSTLRLERNSTDLKLEAGLPTADAICEDVSNKLVIEDSVLRARGLSLHTIHARPVNVGTMDR